jgi:hypothetical protein
MVPFAMNVSDTSNRLIEALVAATADPLIYEAEIALTT